MGEVKSIINSRPLTVETLSDINSQIPLSPSNLLLMKTNFVMPPPGLFTIPEKYGDACSIFQRCFATDGEKSFCKVYKPGKNGMIKGEILKLVTS